MSGPEVPDHGLLRVIGRGSYGEVWLARNIMGVLRAVKVVRLRDFGSERPLAREFAGVQHFEPVSRSHEGFVQILHIGRLAGEAGFFYVMELADDAAGHASVEPDAYVPRTLRSDLDRRGALPPEDVLRHALPLASALCCLHERGLTHRDVKPSNIIFVEGRPKLADVGLVSAASESRSMVGTEGFVPRDGPGTAAADVYALGKVLYEMLTGLDRLEFPSVPAEWVDRPHALAMELMEIIYRACDPRAVRRAEPAAELRADLALLQSGRSVRKVRGLERRVRLLTRAGAGVALAALVAGAAWAVTELGWQRERATRLRVAAAEEEARARLWDAQLATVRAGRHSGREGCRLDSWDALERAAAARPDRILRDEAAGLLALADMRTAFTVPGAAQAVCAFREGPPEIIACGEKSGLRWLARDGSTRRVLPQENGATYVWIDALEPSGRWLAAWQRGGHADLWDLAEERCVHRWHEGAAYVRPSVHAGTARLAYGTEKATVIVRDLVSGAEVAHWVSPAAPAGLLWSPDGTRLALSFRDHVDYAVFDPLTGTPLAQMKLPSAATAAAWSPDGQWLATAGTDGVLTVWRTVDGRACFHGKGHANALQGVAWHPHGGLIATSSWDGTTRLWDAPSARLLVTAAGWGVGLNFSPDGRWLSRLSGAERSATVAEVEAERLCRFAAEIPSGGLPAVPAPYSVEFSGDGTTLASCSDDGVRLWSAADAGEVGFFPSRGAKSAHFLPGEPPSLLVMASSGVKWQPLRRKEGTWHLDSALEATPLDSRATGFGGVAASAEPILAAWGLDARVVVAAGGMERSLPAPHTVWRAVPSPDGRRVAASTSRAPARVTVWSAADGRVLWRTPPLQDRMDLAFSPDSARLAVGSGREISVWRVDDGAEVVRLPRAWPDDLHAPVAFSLDGRVLALAWSRTVVQLVDADTWRPLVSLEAPLPGIVSHLAFSPDGSRLAAATEGGLVQLWDVVALRRRLAALRLDW